MNNNLRRYFTDHFLQNKVYAYFYYVPIHLNYSVSLSRLLIRHSTQKTSVIGMKRFQDVLSLVHTLFISQAREERLS